MVLPPDGDQEIASAIDEPQGAVSPLADIAGAKPAIGTLDLARRFFVAPIAFEQVRAAH